MFVKGTGSWCALEEYVKDNYYATFPDPSYYRYRQRHFRILLDIKCCSLNSNSISLENLEGGWVRWEEVEIETEENSGILRLKYQTFTPRETKAGYCHVLKFV